MLLFPTHIHSLTLHMLSASLAFILKVFIFRFHFVINNKILLFIVPTLVFNISCYLLLLKQQQQQQ